jgi:hypothetical protein
VAKYCAGLLGVFVGQPDNTKNSETYVQNVQTSNLNDMEILVSFNVVSLEDALRILPQKFHKQTVYFIKHVLTTTYFLYDGMF